MERFVREQNLKRYHDLLARVTDEEQREQIKRLISKQETEDAVVIASDAIIPGVIWA
jgi:hypothetical protein